MPTVYFWNAEHLSSNIEVMTIDARARILTAKQKNEDSHALEAIKGLQRSSPITRSMLSGRGMNRFSNIKRVNPAGINISALHKVRDNAEREKRRYDKLGRLEYELQVKKRKLETERWLNSQQHPTFYCEVQPSVPGRVSSLRGMPGMNTNCYKTNNLPPGLQLITPLGFPRQGVFFNNAGNITGPYLDQPRHRIPKMVVYHGTHLFFWHAPSGHSDIANVISAVWDWIIGRNFGNVILFGDLNCPPGELLVPRHQIFSPNVPTRKARTLDYALANFPGVSTSRAFDQAAPWYEIKRRFGSDHAAMRLSW